MQAGPTVSVIIPFYNAEKYLQISVNSITQQTYPKLEIILADDGSCDSSPMIADELAEQDTRVRVINLPHRGVSAARNSGLEAASGRYILFVDSDDQMEKTIIGYMVMQMIREDADMVTCDLAFSDEIHQKQPDRKEEKQPAVQIYTREEYLQLFFKINSNENVHFPVAKLYKKELIPSQLYPEGIRVGEDVLGTYRALAAVNKIVRIRKTGYYYFKNPESVTTRFSPKDFDLLYVWDQVVAITEGKEPDHSYARINRNRINFTLLFRMITEVPADVRQREYDTQIKKLREELLKCEDELLHSPIVSSRKILIRLLCHCYPAMSAAGGFYVKLSQLEGRIPGLTRRKRL